MVRNLLLRPFCGGRPVLTLKSVLTFLGGPTLLRDPGSGSELQQELP